MSKRNHIVERASDVNGGQYIQTNPSYNSGYEDGKKAGKEYCASEIKSLREQVEKLTKERDDLLGYKKYWKEWLNLQSGDARQIAERAEYADALEQQLAALAEQNEKFRETLSRWRYQNLSYNWCCGNCGAVDGDEHKEGCALSLPNLATPVLNRIRAEAMEEAAKIANEHEGVAWAVSAIRNRKAELEKTNG